MRSRVEVRGRHLLRTMALLTGLLNLERFAVAATALPGQPPKATPKQT
jgi:hypothetical protein